MFLAHAFRLRDPWQCDCLTTGETRWSRVFHRPTGLEEDDALWLVCSGLPPEAKVILNGQPLTPSNPQSEIRNPQSPSLQPHTYEVTPLIAHTNKVELLIPSGSLSGPTASSLQTTASPTSFPYDVRLGIIGHS